jgi:hypothetical protein
MNEPWLLAQVFEEIAMDLEASGESGRLARDAALVIGEYALWLELRSN